MDSDIWYAEIDLENGFFSMPARKEDQKQNSHATDNNIHLAFCFKTFCYNCKRSGPSGHPTKHYTDLLVIKLIGQDEQQLARTLEDSVKHTCYRE